MTPSRQLVGDHSREFLALALHPGDQGIERLRERVDPWFPVDGSGVEVDAVGFQRGELGPGLVEVLIDRAGNRAVIEEGLDRLARSVLTVSGPIREST